MAEAFSKSSIVRKPIHYITQSLFPFLLTIRNPTLAAAATLHHSCIRQRTTTRNYLPLGDRPSLFSPPHTPDATLQGPFLSSSKQRDRKSIPCALVNLRRPSEALRVIIFGIAHWSLNIKSHTTRADQLHTPSSSISILSPKQLHIFKSCHIKKSGFID